MLAGWEFLGSIVIHPAVTWDKHTLLPGRSTSNCHESCREELSQQKEHPFLLPYVTPGGEEQAVFSYLVPTLRLDGSEISACLAKLLGLARILQVTLEGRCVSLSPSQT